MIWVLLAMLGVPIWLVVGILAGVWWSRRTFKQQPGVFEIAVRAENATKWKRRISYGRLVRDVLVLNRGLALLRTEIHAVDGVVTLDIDDGPRKPAGAAGRLLDLDDGSRQEVAVTSDVAARLDALGAGSRSA